MAEITAAAVKALRERTGLPMMDCKKALHRGRRRRRQGGRVAAQGGAQDDGEARRPGDHVRPHRRLRRLPTPTSAR